MATISGPSIQLPTTVVGRTVDEQGNLRLDWVAFLSTLQQTVYASTRSGPTASRPTAAMPGRFVGQQYFDTTLGLMVYLKSTTPDVWVNGAGAVV